MIYCRYVSLEWRGDGITLAVVRRKDRLKVTKSVIREALVGEDILQ